MYGSVGLLSASASGSLGYQPLIVFQHNAPDLGKFFRSDSLNDACQGSVQGGNALLVSDSVFREPLQDLLGFPLVDLHGGSIARLVKASIASLQGGLAGQGGRGLVDGNAGPFGAPLPIRKDSP
jgi:hypothetical protein